jgi:hypothetical protein
MGKVIFRMLVALLIISAMYLSAQYSSEPRPTVIKVGEGLVMSVTDKGVYTISIDREYIQALSRGALQGTVK